MEARTCYRLLWSALLLALVHGAYADDQVPEPDCEERKRASMERRIVDTTIDLIDVLPKKWDNKAVTVNFMHIEFVHTNVDGQTLTYGCEPTKGHDSFPAYAGFGWMVLMPSKTSFSLLGRPSRADTTIRSYLEEEIGDLKKQNGASNLRVLVSGPFWKLSRDGEVPIGALVRDNNTEQDFRANFSAKYVLCSTTDGRVNLRDGKVGMFENSTAPSCAAAIQVGPALFERSDDPHGYAKIGIGADSRNRSRRNILIRVSGDAPSSESGGSLILLSTLFDIATYDAMVASERLVRKLSDEGKVVWAVGLVDDESLSGPILTMNGGPTLELTETSRPTGAIMQFIFNGSSSH